MRHANGLVWQPPKMGNTRSVRVAARPTGGEFVVGPQATSTRGERTAELASAPSSVTTARHLVRDDLRRRGLPSRVIEDALVVVTELVGNAVRHARPLRSDNSSGVVVLRWDATESQVRIDVTDGGGSKQPHVEPASLADTGGRGLAIVSAVASDWGVSSDSDRVTVFAVVSA